MILVLLFFLLIAPVFAATPAQTTLSGSAFHEVTCHELTMQVKYQESNRKTIVKEFYWQHKALLRVSHPLSWIEYAGETGWVHEETESNDRLKEVVKDLLVKYMGWFSAWSFNQDCIKKGIFKLSKIE